MVRSLAESVCEICESNTKLWGEKSGFKVLKCTFCGYGVVRPRPSLEELNRFYTKEDHGLVQTGKMKRYRTEVPPWEEPKRILHTLQSMGFDQGRVLDVGAGFGWSADYFHRHGFTVTPLEPNPLYAREIEEKTGLTVVRDFLETWSPEEDLVGTFDIIIMTQVIEHMLYPKLVFEKSRELLRKGGVLVLSTPNFDSLLIKVLRTREGHICPPEHLNFFAPKSLKVLGNQLGYRCAKLYTRSNLTRYLAVEGAKEYLRAKGVGLGQMIGTVAWATLYVADRLSMGRYLYTYFVLDDPS